VACAAWRGATEAVDTASRFDQLCGFAATVHFRTKDMRQ